MAVPHIQVVLADDAVPDSLRTALLRTNATASFWPLSEALRWDADVAADALVLVVPRDVSGMAGPLRVVFDRLAEHPRATLVLTPDRDARLTIDHAPTVPVTIGRGLDEQELCVRLAMMLDMRHSLDSLHRGLLANRRSGESMAKRYVHQLRLASQLQRGFLPDTLPRYGPVSFAALFRPVDYVSGDIYDIRRLDEDHVGIALADASGHGIPAALLTVYIKRALRGKEIENGSYRILSPDEVLARLNDDILEAHLTECPFVAALYAVLNTRTLELALARGGAPYPIHRTAHGTLRLLEVPGGVVGVMPGTPFEATKVQLQRGDSLLIYSDGLERIVAPPRAACDLLPAVRPRFRRSQAGIAAPAPVHARDGHLPAMAAVAVLANERDQAEYEAADRACATQSARDVPGRPMGGTARPLITRSAWWEVLRRDGPAAALEQVAGRQRTLRRMGYPLDDLTVLTVQIDP